MPEIIAPDHGIIWRADPGKILRMYLDMAEGKADLSVAIVYDTMWHSTERMTQAIARGVKDGGVECKVIKLRATPMSVAVKEFWKARGTLIGSPTLNNIVFPTIAQFLTYLRGLRPKNRLVGAFGSLGWGGGAVKEVYEAAKQMGLETHRAGHRRALPADLRGRAAVLRVRIWVRGEGQGVPRKILDKGGG